MKKLHIIAATAFAVAACVQNEPSALQEKVESYAVVEVKSPLYDALSENDKKIVDLFRQAGEIIDGLFWKQTFGDKAEMEALKDEYAKAYAMINYGPWDQLDDNKPFVEGYGEKPLGCQYYPQDMTKEEFEAFDDPDKLSLYTVIRRDENGALKTVWYRDEYKAELDKAIVSLKNLSEKLQDPNGSVGKLLSTDSLHNSVNDLVKDIDELVERITENPKKYIRVSVF